MKWFFDMDNPVMRTLSMLADVIVLNLLTLLCSLPIVTAGAAITALNDACIRLVRLEDGEITIPEAAPATAPDCVVTADEGDLLAVASQEQSPVTDLLFGKIKVRGDKGMLLNLARTLM